MRDERVSGEYAWLIMALGILAYDLTAIKTQKIETMSTALWKSLTHPLKFPVAPMAWLILTYHLFASKPARNSIKTLSTILYKKDYYAYE